jgi:hypothetical protein
VFNGMNILRNRPFRSKVSQVNTNILSEILGSYGGKYEYDILLGYCAA